jgi:predicted Zn-dependent peptidase
LTFPHAGSSSELASESGAALANKFMAFKSGSGLSSAVILRNLENYGATPFASADREGAVIGFTAATDNAMHLLPLLATTCTYEKWDVKGALDTAAVEVKESLNNIQVRRITLTLFADLLQAFFETDCIF